MGQDHGKNIGELVGDTINEYIFKQESNDVVNHGAGNKKKSERGNNSNIGVLGNQESVESDIDDDEDSQSNTSSSQMRNKKKLNAKKRRIESRVQALNMRGVSSTTGDIPLMASKSSSTGPIGQSGGRKESKSNHLGLLAAELQQLSEKQKMLVLLDECDHLIQQEHFQDGLECLLKDCPNVSFLISTHQPIYYGSPHQQCENNLQTAFKNVHVTVKRLSVEDTGKLFLRRLQRVITWSDLGYAITDQSEVLKDDVVRLGQNPNETAMIYRKVGQAPRLQSADGIPRKIIELAMKFSANGSF